MRARFAAMLALALLLAQPVSGNSEGIPLDFRERPLREIVEEIARAIGMTVAIDGELKGSATLATPRRVSNDEALAILEAALLFGGYALLPSVAGVRKLLPISDAIPGAPRTTLGSRSTRDSVVATIVGLEWALADEVSEKLQHLVSRQAIVVAYAPTNSLILVGREARMARLIGLAKLLDQEQGESKVWIRSIRYRAAAEVASLVRSVLDRPSVAIPAQIEEDERTNRLVVKADRDALDFIRDLVARLDQPAERTGDLEVLPVLFRDPADLATLLSELSTGSAADPRLSDAAAGLVGRTFAVVPDGRTRSLLIHADPETRARIRNLVTQLDLPPRQVLLEFKVVEFSKPVSLNLNFDFFLPLNSPKNRGDPVASLFSNPSGGGLRSSEGNEDKFFSRVGRKPLLLTGTDPVTGQPVQVLVPRETAVIRANQTSVTTKLISQPRLVAIAGEEHTLTVGNNIPIPVSAGDSAASSQFLRVSQTIERYDTGVKVRVRPTIGQAGKIRLELDFQIDAVVPSTEESVDRVGPILAQRQAATTLLLRPGEIAIIGMSNDKRVLQGVSKVPFLGDIPFLGWFFRSVRDEVRDRQIVMTVQARSIDSPSEMEAESIRQRMDFERSLARLDRLATSQTRPFTIRVASLTSLQSARGLESRLASLGFDAYRASWAWEENHYFDVYVGAYADVFDLSTDARRLEQAGFPAELVVGNDGFGSDRRASQRTPDADRLALRH